MSKPYADREIWFLTGSQDLYGEETLRQVAEQSQEVARALDASPDVPATVVWKPVLKDAGALRRARGALVFFASSCWDTIFLPVSWAGRCV